MAAPMRKTLTLLNRLNVFQRCCHVLKRLYKPLTGTGVAIGAGTVVRCGIQTIIPTPNVEDDTQKDPVVESGGEKLTAKELIKNGSIVSVDAATSILTQTTSRLVQLEAEYVQAVYKLKDMLDYNVRILGNQMEEEIVWDLVLQFRSKVNEIKAKKQELELFYQSVEKLMNITSEVAFMAGADYAGTCAGERLYSSQQQLQISRVNTEQAEQLLCQSEVRLIEQTSRYAEQREKVELEELEEGLTEKEAESDNNSDRVNVNDDDENT